MTLDTLIDSLELQLGWRASHVHCLTPQWSHITSEVPPHALPFPTSTKHLPTSFSPSSTCTPCTTKVGYTEEVELCRFMCSMPLISVCHRRMTRVHRSRSTSVAITANMVLFVKRKGDQRLKRSGVQSRPAMTAPMPLGAHSCVTRPSARRKPLLDGPGTDLSPHFEDS